MTETASAKLDTIMARVQKLLAVADDPAMTEEASANYRAKAEALMVEYRIAEEDLIAEDQFSILPVRKDLELMEEGKGEFSNQYMWIWESIVEHCGIRTARGFRWDGDRTTYVIRATVVGYSSDIRYAEFLWNSCRLAFALKLEPSVDATLSEAENVYRLRSAGIERNRISKIMWDNPSHSNNAKVTRLYAKACEARGEDPAVSGRSISAKDYRKVYARSFAMTIDDRLRLARDATGQMGAGIELSGRKERVDEAFYEIFPQARPRPASDEPAVKEECEDCKRTKSKTGKCKLHRPAKMTAAERAKIRREWYSETAQRASAAGKTAADDVQISRTGRTGRIEETSADAVGELTV